MNWILAAFGVLISSTILFITLRKTRPLNLSNEIQNLSFYFFPALILFIYSITSRLNLRISILEIFTILLASIFLWIGNKFLLKSFRLVQNPGYSLLIAKSYVIITTLFAPLLFGSILTLKSLISIAIIIIFSSFVMIEKDISSEKQNTAWLLYAIGTFVFWGIHALALGSMKDSIVSPVVIVMYMSIFYSSIVLIELVIKKTSLKPARKHFFWLFIISISTMFLNIFIIIGYKLAPNPGYIDAANTASVSAITLLAVVFFKDELTLKKAVGIIGVTAGLILLFI